MESVKVDLKEGEGEQIAKEEERREEEEEEEEEVRKNGWNVMNMS